MCATTFESIQAESKRSKLHLDTFSVSAFSVTCLGFLQVDAECLEAALTLVMLKHDQGRILDCRT
jgi:hypothetical protein